MTVFDNGNGTEQSRVVEYALDQENLTITEFESYQIDGWYTGSRGSTDRLSTDEDIFLIGWGYLPNTGALFSEINFETGEILLEVFAPDDSLFSYRTFKSES